MKNPNDGLVAGFWSGHDCSYCVIENGKVIRHDEYERFIREKEPVGDSLKFLVENFDRHREIKYFATCHPGGGINRVRGSASSDENSPLLSEHAKILRAEGREVHIIGHHQSHAANAFYSSNFDEALIFTIDGGGIEDAQGTATCFTVWQGQGTSIENVATDSSINVGGVWTRCTRYIFGLSSGWPTGHQAGTVMAMAAFGDPSKYQGDFYRMLTSDLSQASARPQGQPPGVSQGKDPRHPYLYRWTKIANRSEQDKFDLAAGLQAATELFLKELLSKYINPAKEENICLSGGVVLNSVFVGKIKAMFPNIKNVFVTPTPHDGGLTIGAAQYLWHHVLGNPRDFNSETLSPYLGRSYSESEIRDAIKGEEGITFSKCEIDGVVDLLMDQNIISVFKGGSESGRRALGNRSIIADPRSIEMKDKVNLRVKHRQWFRPFAPSILRENVVDWFEEDVESPYMSMVANMKPEMASKVAAVAHQNGSARLQTVTRESNAAFYDLLKKWEAKSGVPILLNTSFNDREPICETPSHAIKCFMGTDIDYLYFADVNILVRKDIKKQKE